MTQDLLPLLQPTDRAEGRPTRILLVDDEQDQVTALATRLQQQGYVTSTASNGEEALRRAREDRPHLVLLDVGLPDINGLEVCEQLVDGVETCGLPVVIVSGTDSPDIVRRCRAAGSEYFVRKPYDPNVLLALIERALDQSW